MAAALFAVFLVMAFRVTFDLRNGRRRWDWTLTPSRMVRVGVIAAVVGAWWVFWYTDIVMTRLKFAPTSVAVRLDPWPTVFVWISWSFTLLLLGIAAAGFAPVRKTAP